MNGSLQDVQRLGQSIWYDNIRRGLLASGELEQLIQQGVTGLTSNPTIFEKAIAGSTDYDEALVSLAREGQGTQESYERLAMEDIRAAADLLRPVYDRTDGKDGYACLEVSPALAHNTETTIAEALRLFVALDRPNIMMKVPATPAGIPAVRRLIGQGINVNVTLIFSLDVHRQVMEAYIAGLEDLARAGGDLSRVSSVASFFVSRVDTAVDTLLEERSSQGSKDAEALLGKAAIANAKLAYQSFKDAFGGERFATLRAKGAFVQRPLWASTGTKNPAYSDVLYIDQLIGKDTVNTTPPATLTAFMEHGQAEAKLEQGVADAGQAMNALDSAGVSIDEVTAKLLADGVKSFADSFDQLLANVEEKKDRLLTQAHVQAGASLGKHLQLVEATLADLQQSDLVRRIWKKDHTVWKPDPTEIADRLGWLKVPDSMCEQLPTLQALAQDVRADGVRHVVLLGMGGSSLGPEVIRQTFGSAQGFPELLVLDSTIPSAVQAVADKVDPAKTLFLVSSKSGTTTEPLAFYSYFRGLVDEAVGKDEAGNHFVAITDPGTPLEKMAREHGFRRVFQNPPDIGGRYSVLSYFGLVPAALTGMYVAALLDRAKCMKEGCATCEPNYDNPGAWLGATMGTLALQGHDKLTLVTSPSIGSFGLWVEQLIAESTGKEGRGIIPVAGEPLVDPASYGDDRLFVYLRLEGDDNADTDAAIAAIESSGQPVVRLELKDRYDLGGEFFRWEFATSVAGALLGIHPFDQPNVQQAKDETVQGLQEHEISGRLPQVEAAASIADLLSAAGTGDYLAIMAYVRQTPETDRALEDLRRMVTERHHVATTLGYGPRFLHSTGQVHKGGPGSGLFLQLTVDEQEDISVPGQSYTFGLLAEAQALGDLKVLLGLGRRVARIRLTSGAESDIRRLVADVDSAPLGSSA